MQVGTCHVGRERLWAAYVGRDTRFDGQFVAGVRTTGVFCRPSCSCRRPRPERVEYFSSAHAAERAGYRPCKRCRPDLPGGTAEAERRFAQRVLQLMQDRLDEPLTVEQLAAAMGASASSLAHRFRAADGRSPMRALADLRIERAKAILAGTDATVLETGFRAGFRSLSAFSRAFQQRTGLPPSIWRAYRARAAGAPVRGVRRRIRAALEARADGAARQFDARPSDAEPYAARPVAARRPAAAVRRPVAREARPGASPIGAFLA
ncbi:MAG TPA: Ada metal-binding domain-containing protein [Thermodesulfobacteriota bacterium]